MLERLKTLITEDQLQGIERAKVLLVGIGGVGGYVLEGLIRSGFKDITIIDGDRIDESNLNRQIITCMNNIGEAKVNEAYKRAISINPNADIKVVDAFLTKDNIYKEIGFTYDYIIDACDDMDVKVELVKLAKANNIEIISALGTGRKLDGTKLKISKLNKTFNDPLAKKLRHLLRGEGISLDIPVIFSEEEAIKTEDMVGSAVFVPAIAGMLMANYVFLKVINKKRIIK